MIINNAIMAEKVAQNFGSIMEDLINFAFETGWDFIVDKCYAGCNTACIYAGRGNVIKRQFYVSRPHNDSFEIGVKRFLQDDVPDDTVSAEVVEKDSSQLAAYLADWYGETECDSVLLKKGFHQRTKTRLAHTNFHVYLI